MAKKNQLGYYAFLAGILVAIASVFVTSDILVMALFGTGVLVGLLNINKQESQSFTFVAGFLALVGISFLTEGFGLLPGVGSMLGGVLTNLGSFVTAASITFLLTSAVKMLNK